MKLLDELRRRNVIRMAGLYLVGAWLVVQVAGTLLPMFGTPGWVAKALVLLLAIGFVPALVFSWVFELTPDGLKRDGEVAANASIAAATGRRMDRLIFAGLIALIVVIAADRTWPRAEPAPTPTLAEASANPSAAADPANAAAAGADAATPPGTTAANAIPAAALNAIAVLPFVNMSADADNEFFSDGISEELLNVLVRVEGLDVASRTSSFAYKGRELGTRRIAEELRVSYLLEGSVRKAGNKVRITAQLIDAGNDRHLWSETYDRDLDDIFVIQDEIANAIVTALREELKGATAPLAAVRVQADTDNLPAYESYLAGREKFITRSDIAGSIRLFERAVELDPAFARGWEGLAAAASVAESWGIVDRDYTAVAKDAAARALALDPTLSLPWAALAMAVGNDMPSDAALALEHFGKALAADPRDATTYLWRAITWLNLGFLDRAMADFAQCRRLDPAYQNCKRWNAVALLYSDPDAAMALYEEGAADGFNDNRGLDFVPYYHARGDRLAVWLLLREADITPGLARHMAAALDTPGPIPDWKEFDDLMPALVGDRAAIYLWFGDFARVASADEPVTADTIIAWRHAPPGWYGSPEFRQTMERTGVADYWRAHGFPPQCEKRGGDDFVCGPMGSK